VASGASRSPAPVGLRIARALILSVLSAAAVGCHNGPCKAPGVAEGEQFQITVLAVTGGPCTIAPLAPGESFVLTGGAALMDGQSCTVVGASPEVPAFASAVLTSCRESQMQLGLDCMGMIDPSCPVSAQLRLAPHIDPGVASIDHGTFSIIWTGSSCNPGGCIETYDVRIDRLTAIR
jgi:hypothetical protein